MGSARVGLGKAWCPALWLGALAQVGRRLRGPTTPSGGQREEARPLAPSFWAEAPVREDGVVLARHVPSAGTTLQESVSTVPTCRMRLSQAPRELSHFLFRGQGKGKAM